MVFTNPTALKVDRLMSISYPVLDYIEVHRRQSGSEWTVDTLGDKLRFYDRVIPHRYFVLPMSLNAGETQEWIFRVDTSSSMQFPVSLWEERDFFVLVQIFDNVEHLFHDLWGQAHRRFVQKHHARVGHQGTANGTHLLFAT